MQTIYNIRTGLYENKGKHYSFQWVKWGEEPTLALFDTEKWNIVLYGTTWLTEQKEEGYSHSSLLMPEKGMQGKYVRVGDIGKEGEWKGEKGHGGVPAIMHYLWRNGSEGMIVDVWLQKEEDRKLMEYYEKLGFKAVTGKPFYDLLMLAERKTLEEIAKSIEK